MQNTTKKPQPISLANRTKIFFRGFCRKKQVAGRANKAPKIHVNVARMPIKAITKAPAGNINSIGIEIRLVEVVVQELPKVSLNGIVHQPSFLAYNQDGYEIQLTRQLANTRFRAFERSAHFAHCQLQPTGEGRCSRADNRLNGKQPLNSPVLAAQNDPKATVGALVSSSTGIVTLTVGMAWFRHEESHPVPRSSFSA